jgi:hypothetical protein
VALLLFHRALDPLSLQQRIEALLLGRDEAGELLGVQRAGLDAQSLQLRRDGRRGDGHHRHRGQLPHGLHCEKSASAMPSSASVGVPGRACRRAPCAMATGCTLPLASAVASDVA